MRLPVRFQLDSDAEVEKGIWKTQRTRCSLEKRLCRHDGVCWDEEREPRWEEDGPKLLCRVTGLCNDAIS